MSHLELEQTHLFQGLCLSELILCWHVLVQSADGMRCMAQRSMYQRHISSVYRAVYTCCKDVLTTGTFPIPFIHNRHQSFYAKQILSKSDVAPTRPFALLSKCVVVAPHLIAIALRCCKASPAGAVRHRHHNGQSALEATTNERGQLAALNQFLMCLQTDKSTSLAEI